MTSDYAAIRSDNERRYGTDIGRIGPMLLADRYDDRTHFIYELLQNAEDALARRAAWNGHRSVRFELGSDELRVSHFGKPFDEADVRGICGIAESTKDLTAIGRFGIGFKSVYAFTDRPRIHSGQEDFAIESFVWPVAVSVINRAEGETVITIPLRSETLAGDHAEITAGLQRLGARTLLFLRQVDEIEWAVKDGPRGLYLRSPPETLAKEVRRVTLLGQADGEPDLSETWLVFSRPIFSEDGKQAGYVEVAFRTVKDNKLDRERVLPVSRSPLVVFFPTVVETHLGFLLQGPYRTTPSRDNVPRQDTWNQHCVQETANVLADALRWLRDHELLDTGTLRSLPLDEEKFSEGTMFGPLFDGTKRLLLAEPLLPRFDGSYTSAVGAKLARTQDLRQLFDSARLTALFDAEGELAWLTGRISQDRHPELRQYLIHELEIAEVTPEAILSLLTADFLGAQPDDWILKFYEFLNDQPALKRRLLSLPLIRLTDGTHVVALDNGLPQAFLPSGTETGFPTVRSAVCSSRGAREFLRTLGLTEPDPVDDVVWNVLPKYREEDVSTSDDAYEADIRRILTAFASDSKSQREKLLSALRETPFVMAVDTGDAKEYVATPGELYLATERLRQLFAGVPGVLRVDDSYACLRGEEVRELLEACGAVRYLRPISQENSFGWEELRRMRIAAGCESKTDSGSVEDTTLSGLDELLAYLEELDGNDRRTRAQCLWDALGDLESRRGSSVFSGSYHWYYYHRRTTTFEAAFVRLLNEKTWVPDSDGHLQEPGAVVFESLGWKANQFLLSKISFKPPLIDQLAKEAGFEPGVLDLLKKSGITSEAQLRELLGVEDESTERINRPGDVDEALGKLLGDAPAPTLPAPDPASAEPGAIGAEGAASDARTGVGRSGGTSTGAKGGDGTGKGHRNGPTSQGGRKQPAGSAGPRPFVSYVAAHANQTEPDPDGLAQAARMALEAKAIGFIVSREPEWQRTPVSNRGFDLFQAGPDGKAARWCEVKAMTGTLYDRPVGLSREQFDWAREHGGDYWLYVVEHAGNERPRLVRIQDPMGKARTFTFDHGWLVVAEVTPIEKSERNKVHGED